MLRKTKRPKYLRVLLKDHFGKIPPHEIATAIRTYPIHLRADLQLAFNMAFHENPGVVSAVGLGKVYGVGTPDFSELWTEGRGKIMAAPLQSVEIDVGGGNVIKCLKNALWLLIQEDVPHAFMVSEAGDYGQATEIQIEIAAPPSDAADRLIAKYFAEIQAAILEARSYRGKVLSLEQNLPFSEKATGVMVHNLENLSRDDVILPQPTLDLLDRNIFDFLMQRERLAALGMSLRKGLLFYGPPGTGKTHSLRYLASQLKEHTVLLITAERMGLLGAYLSFAKLLEPTIVVIEDVDLIARSREDIRGLGEAVVLNQLLNEIDGLREDAKIIFILTTNRPEVLEAALTSRPGRVDQAIEFPLPDADSRARLVMLYARGVTVPDGVLETIVRRTDQVSPAFIKELMRRACQYCLGRNEGTKLEVGDVDKALDEILVTGGRLNAALLGGRTATTSDRP